jgi:monoamine oxidase
VACSFKEPFWKKKTKTLPAFQGIFRGELYGQNYWEASRQQHGSHAILTSQRGGTIGFTTGASAIEETLKDLRNFNKEAMSEENSQITNWSQKPFSKGSRYNIGPGNYLKFLEFLTDENDKLNFYFAGEHMSFRDFGTMNGALESAITVADRAMQKAFLKSTFGT